MVTSLNTGHPNIVPDSNKEREISLTNSNIVAARSLMSL